MSAAMQTLVPLALADRSRMARLLDKVDSAKLRDYIRVFWPIIEPNRPLIGGWSLDCLCDHFEAITAGQIRRLLINIPPGCMKSIIMNVLWPTWEWGPKGLPHLRYLLSSYSKKLSVRDNRKSRLIIESPKYQSMWGDTVQIVSDSNAKERFDNSQEGFRMATSVGGVGTGERGDRFLIDDPHNVMQADSTAIRESALDYFANTVPTRINDAEKSVICVVMQRVHANDVSGLILREELNYEWLCLPMEFEKGRRCFTSVPRGEPEIVTRFRREADPVPRWLTETEYEEEMATGSAEPITSKPIFQELYSQDPRTEEGELLWATRFSKRHLEEDLKPQLRSWGGSYAEAGQLQQRPAPREGGLFHRNDFHIEDVMPDLPVVWVRGWDLAASTDRRAAYTCGIRMGFVGDGSVWITDVRRKRASPAGVEEMIRIAAQNDGHGVEQSLPQDPGQSGVAQKAALAKVLHGFKFHFSPETGSKPKRAQGLAAQAEAGNLYLLRGPWNDAFIAEACLFPTGDFLDQIDGASRAYGRLLSKRPKQRIGVPKLIGG